MRESPGLTRDSSPRAKRLGVAPSLVLISNGAWQVMKEKSIVRAVQDQHLRARGFCSCLSPTWLADQF
jgi:hypothetical protein